MMEWIVAISVIASSAVSITHAIISYKKSRVPPPDPVWDAALQITLANGMPDADSFAQTYQELKAFKENGCSLGGNPSLSSMIRSASQSTIGQSGRSTEEFEMPQRSR